MTREKKAKMVQLIDLIGLELWKLPQSGWRKQDYLPKVNIWT